ncbi:MAG: substrate-binding domain-containing protein [Nitrospirota bacterium]|nr:substrate-binding domain-containing protein [Nitrospirota bacterium]
MLILERSAEIARVLALVGALCGSAIAGEDIVLSGSSTVQKRILEPVQKALEKRSGTRVQLLGVGTIKGISALIKGEAAAAMMSSSLEVAFREIGIPSEGTYQEHVIMKDTVVAVVHPGNPVKSLTWEHLSDINTGKITNWKEIGGKDGRIVVVAAPRGAGTRAVVRDMVMQGKDYADSAYTTITTREVVDIVTKSPIAIGTVSEGFVKMNKGKVKVLKMKPITRELSIVTKDDISPALAAIIKFLKSPEAKKLFL